MVIMVVSVVLCGIRTLDSINSICSVDLFDRGSGAVPISAEIVPVSGAWERDSGDLYIINISELTSFL